MPAEVKAWLQTLDPTPDVLYVLTLGPDATDWRSGPEGDDPVRCVLEFWRREFPGVRLIVLPFGARLETASKEDLAKMGLTRLDPPAAP